MEIWVPYGEVESLITLMQENLGETLDPRPESHLDEMVVTLLERLKGAERIFILDLKPATVKVVKALVARLPKEGVRFVAAEPRKLESEVPELKDLVLKLRPPAGSTKATRVSPDLQEPTKKFSIATGEPDPLLGFIDAPVALAMSCIEGARRLAYERRDGDAPQPLREDSPSYSAVRSLFEGSGANDAGYATIITRGGAPYSIVEGDAVKQARTHYLSDEVPQTKGMVVGVGGKGYDDSLSHAIRLAVGSLKGVRKGGEIVLVAECKEGMGSEALQLYLTGRMSESFLKRGSYVESLEEISYVLDLREKYSVTLISSLPELYAGGKLRFRTARGSGEALGKVFASIGRNAKLNVVTRACETVLP
ncbi:MAG: hypothetical protein OK455_00655 [Thaumarchaeota archaeon]|nr:hypothetical protein [Nitrososphaerota archaeon]